MWILKATVPGHSGQLIASRTKKFKIKVVGFPVSSAYEKKKLIVTSISHLSGSDANKKAFIKDIKKEKRLRLLEINKDLIITQIEQHELMGIMYNPKIFFITPFVADEKGDNHFEVACWDKEPLQMVAKLFLSKDYDGKIISFRQSSISSVFSLRLLPEITDKQKRAFDLAVNEGYYEYPRKTSMVKLAKVMKTSYTTYNSFLRRAERKIMPYFSK